MSDGGLVTADVGSFTVTTNSGVSKEALEGSLKPKSDKAASEAASQLGKRGGKASAEARAAREEAEPSSGEAASNQETAASKPIKPIPPKVEAKPEAKAQEAVDEAERRAEEKMAEDAEASRAEEAKPEPEKKDHRGDPRHDPVARMHEATRQAAEAKRELAAERQRRADLEARIAAIERGERPQAQPERASQPDKGNGKPTPQDYETYEDYLDARDVWNREQWEGEIRQRTEMQSLERTLHQAVDRFRSAASTVLDQISPEVGNLRTEFQLGPGETPTGENWTANEIVFSPETAPALMLYFTAHPEELQRIAALPNPRAVSREMAKLETRLESATTGTAPEREVVVSKAAPPVKPVTGKPYVSESDEYKPGMSLDEYYKLRKRASPR